MIKTAKDVIIYVVICNPFQEPAYGSKWYFLCMMTTQHRYVRAKPIMNKSETHQLCLVFIAWIERNFKSTVKRVCCDNGIEFVSMRKVLNKMMITMTTSSSYSPQSNDLSNHVTRALMKKVRALLKEGQLDWRYWGEALHQAV